MPVLDRESKEHKVERATAKFEVFLDAMTLYIDHRRDDMAKPFALRANCVDAFRDLMMELSGCLAPEADDDMEEREA